MTGRHELKDRARHLELSETHRATQILNRAIAVDEPEDAERIDVGGGTFDAHWDVALGWDA